MRSFLALLFTLSLASAQETTRLRDVIYQKRDGFALTLDVFTPAKPNGAAMIKIVSGVGTPITMVSVMAAGRSLATRPSSLCMARNRASISTRS